MDSFLINGKKKFTGTVKVSGAKNAILPIMVATILTRGRSVLTNVPQLDDLTNMSHLLRVLGAVVEKDENQMRIDTKDVNAFVAPYDIVNKMRASIYVLGPLLARFGHAKVAFPGGCAIGNRPVDMHLMCMEKLGAKVKIEHGYIFAECPDGLRGATIEFPFVSVGATVNCLLAAVLAEGVSHIKNIALEPDIDSLIECLLLMGAKIEKKDINDLIVTGVRELEPFEMKMIPDRIEAGTLLLAAAITKSNITISDCEPKHLGSLLLKMEQAGCRFQVKPADNILDEPNEITINPAMNIKPVDVVTEPYPGFPTDLQAQFLAYMCLAEGKSHIKDTIFPDRFMHVAELNRLGANIYTKDGMATVYGVSSLSGAEVMATDLRASATLVLAGLAAEGVTKISRIYHIDRGYERLEEKLNMIGADIKRITVD